MFSLLEVKRAKVVQKLNTNNLSFNFLFGFFEQDHLLNLIILGIYTKR